MNTTMTATRTYRPRPLSPETLVKIAQAQARSARGQRVTRIRAGLRALVDAGEREWERRRVASVGGGADVPKLLVDALAVETDFDALVAEDLK
jgi:hypothetical protein